jgi:endoglucanase
MKFSFFIISFITTGLLAAIPVIGTHFSLVTVPPLPKKDNSNIVKIPMDANRWYIVGANTKTVSFLTNGVLDEDINTGYVNFQTTYECIYPVDEGEGITLHSIKMYDYTGICRLPAQVFVIKEDGTRQVIGQFAGDKYQQWVGPYTKATATGAHKFLLNSPIANIRAIGLVGTENGLPTEFELYGEYKKPANTTGGIAVHHSPVLNMLGVNGFEWDFVNPKIDSRKIDATKYAGIKHFTGFRHYLDWERMENEKGSYTFNPCHGGGWSYDLMYETCKKDSIEVLVCLKNIPKWLLQTYPKQLQAADNAPLPYGANRLQPRSYEALARMGFQFAARYGHHQQLSSTLLQVNTNPRWTADPPNVPKKAMGLVKYIECGNEPDKWWRQAQGYLNCNEYAALLSAFYDGHKGSLGPGIGIKQADPDMQVVMGGLANSHIGYVRGMLEWCRINRGYRSNGMVDVCWDVVNYHHYANIAGNSQVGNAGRGAAPELGGVAQVANSFVKFANQYLNGMPVWVTELGYDHHPQSTQRAVSTAKTSVWQTQANWLLRSALINLKCGVNSMFFYELKDYNALHATKFATMGLLDSQFAPRPALNYLYQFTQLMGNYTYKYTRQTLPIVDVYTKEDEEIFVVWVPDEKDTQLPFALSFLRTDSVTVFTPQTGQSRMSATNHAVVDALFEGIATETPVFIKAMKKKTN